MQYCRYIYMFLYSTATEHWKTLIVYSNVRLLFPNARLLSDSQLVLRAVEGAFTYQDAIADNLLVARFDSTGVLESYACPKAKLQDISTKVFALLKKRKSLHSKTFLDLAVNLLIFF